jgi:hypothetical protein
VNRETEGLYEALATTLLGRRVAITNLIFALPGKYGLVPTKKSNNVG